MEDRRFTEFNLRRMLESATDLRPDIISGRWVIVARFRRRGWEIIVEPDSDIRRLVVITAYPTGASAP